MYSYYPDHGYVIRDSDRKQVAPCQSVDEQDFQDYLAWIYAGNTPAEPPAPESIIDIEVVKKAMVDAVQFLLDETAKTRNYDNILSLCTYANSTIQKFKNEGQAGVNWRDACWATCYQIMYDVQTGQRQLPSVEQVLSELPQIIW